MLLRTLLATLLSLGALPLGACGDDDDDDIGGEGEGECVQDTSDAPGNAIPLDVQTTEACAAAPDTCVTEGFICPLGDRDFYRITVPESSLLRVKLLLEAPLSQVGIGYNVYDAAGEVLQVTGSTVAAGVPLDEVSCPAAGEYLVLVADQSDDAFDFRHPYQLTVTTEPEPDQGESDAEIPLGLGSSTTGLISCLGDIDAYGLDVPANTLLGVHLTSDVASYEPSYRVLKPNPDGSTTLLYQNMNESGSVQATDIQGLYTVPTAGHYILEVLDWEVDDEDRRTADADTPYTLEVSATAEPDPYDQDPRNDTANTATALGAMSCGGSYGGQTINGYFSAIGDIDWFRVPLSGCGNGIVQVSLSTAGTDMVDPQIRLVRRYAAKPCTRDEECVSLDITCDYDIDCAGWGNTCVGVHGDPDRRDEDPTYEPGTCAGASACVAGACGATQFEKNAQAGTAVATAQPLLDTDQVYVVVNDFRSDASDVDTSYSLRIETRADPDAFERDSVYNPYPFRFIEREINEDLAQPSGSAEAGFCITGTMATENDEDWFYYSSACPDQQAGVDACTINVDSTFDAGPVDFVVTVVRNGDDWFQPAAVDEAGNNSSMTVPYGPPNECFFAVEGDTGYYIVVTDNRGTRNNPTAMDWSDTQQYNVCFRPYVVGCNAPCQWIAEGGGGCNL